MDRRNFIVATAGHVDHGKSALVKALTGTDPDRLPEEKARGITIDLGFASLELPGGSELQARSLHLGLVDVPGHEDFVKNMVSGVGAVDLALFVVAADDGWMPQSEEHLEIFSYLGVARGVVVLTKVDLAQNEEEVRARLVDKLAGSPLANAPVVATSIVSGRGLDALKEAIRAVLANAPEPRDIQKPRLPVDRVFTLRGVGTVVTGTLTGGELHRGQSVVIQPAGAPARIRAVQNYHCEVERSGPGTRTALNLVDVGAVRGERNVRRGDVITLSHLGAPSRTLGVMLVRSGRPGPLRAGAERPLQSGTRVRLHLGSGNVAARAVFLSERTLERGGESLAELRLEEPVFAFVGDRFILRDWQEQATLAGGCVLDTFPDTLRTKSRSRRELLRTRSAAPNAATGYVLSEVERACAVPAAGLLVNSRFSKAEIGTALKQLAAEKQLVLDGGWAMSAAWWEKELERVRTLIDEGHRTHPDRPGTELAQIKSALGGAGLGAELVELALRQLCETGFTRAGTLIGRAAHQVILPPHLQAACARVRHALGVHPFEPPSRKELAPDPPTQQALRFLLETGEAVGLNDDVVLLAESARLALDRIKSFLRERGSATASELRQVIGTSRRIVIPLLEKMDKEGVTRREGDRRVLRQATG